MTLTPTQKYWSGWIGIGLVSLVAEYFVVYHAVVAALRTVPR